MKKKAAKKVAKKKPAVKKKAVKRHTPAAAVPAKLFLKGVGLTRTVLFKTKEKDEWKVLEGSGFNWGYSGAAPRLLADLLLKKLFKGKEQFIKKHHEDFMVGFIALFPQTNFEVTINLGKWYQLIVNGHNEPHKDNMEVTFNGDEVDEPAVEMHTEGFSE